LFIYPVRAGDDALPIIKKAFESARANEAIARSYVFRERVEECRFNKKGEVKKRGSTTYDVTLLDSSEYRRLIAIDDKPLFPKTAAKEERKLEKQIERMRNETPKHRRARLAKVEKGREEGERFLEEITRAFDFRLIGEEEIAGVATYVISADPKAGYEPLSRETKVLPKVRGTLWVSKEDHAWVKADMETLANIRWAVVFKLSRGAKIRFEQRKINDEVWLTDNWYVRLRAKAALVFKFNGELTGRYSDYQRFETDSTVIPGDPAR
jgi:hypothetical protein